MEKYCGRCETTKPISDFNSRKGSRGRSDGHQAYCRGCQKVYLSERYTATKDVYAVKVRERKIDLRRQFAEIKSSLKCARCPENHPAALDFHHHDPSTKELGVSAMVHSGWHIDRIKEEIAKCEVLCANCHRKHHWDERNGAA